MQIAKGYKQTEVGVIPEDWEVSKVSSFAEVKSGKRLPLGESLSKNVTPHPYVRVTDMFIGGVSQDDIRYVPQHVYPSISRYRIFSDDIFISVAGTLGIVGTVPIELNGANLTENANRFTKITINRDFLFHHLTAPPIQNTIDSIRTVGAQPKLALTRVREFEIPIPPTKAEQEAIAEALSDADSLIESLQQLIAKKRQIKQGAMQELLTGKRRVQGFENDKGYKQTEVGEIPEDWSIKTAKELCLKIQDGTHFSPELGGNDFLYITSKNIRAGYLKLDTAEKISEQEHKKIFSRCDVTYGDLLLTKDGASTGNATLNTLTEEFSLLSSVAFLRFHKKSYSASFFLQQILSYQGQQQIQEAMAGNAITRLTLEKINKLRFPTPKTLTEQTRIATILSDMDEEITTLETKLTKAQHIKQGMMSELLTGKTRLV